MPCAIAHTATSSPILPAIERQTPLRMFDGPSDLDGDPSIEAGPERYVVTGAVQDPDSTDVPEAVPVLSRVPTGTVEVHEAPMVLEDAVAIYRPSSSSDASQSTPRPATIEEARSSSSSSSSQSVLQATGTAANGRQDPVPGSDTPVEPIVVRSGTTMLMNIVPKDAPPDSRSTTVMITVGEEERSVPLHRVSVPQRSILKEPMEPNDDAAHVKKDGSSELSGSSRKSLRLRVVGMWRRLVAKILRKREARKEETLPHG